MNRETEIPNDIIEAERKISLYFAERNIKEWALGGIQNRLELPKQEPVMVQYYLPQYDEWESDLGAYEDYVKSWGTDGIKERTLYTAPQTKGEYVPMTDDELLQEFDACDYKSRLTSYPHITLMNLRKVETEVVRRMKEQGLT